ncbi:cache domain-containing sensor histidine kinase [Paenibacillus hexagrammi]|uniref:Histidine kinase n=1 Tax=Paenibacillus hexagrammi TaxID=2908839 RepID=A0ABY3SPQ5_9BACL|nr:sensor histidine kinase [Paenibacillus sp. YPD9-1]UJF34962.1 histidine kinase [Paenibacillus sp. YPD9-1]
MKKGTLRSRLILGFAMVTVPLVVLLIWNNMYAMKVVHSQVAQSNKNMLTMYMNQIDQVLEELDKYLYRTANQDNDLISLSAFDPDNPESYYAKIRTLNAMYVNTNYYKDADVLFAYSSRYDELLTAPQPYMNNERKESIKSRLIELMKDKDSRSPLLKSWVLIHQDDQYSLVRVVDTGYESFIGAWVDINRLMIPLNLLHLGESGQALFLSKEGAILNTINDKEFADKLHAKDWNVDLLKEEEPYQIVRLWENYLLVVQSSRNANMYLSVMIPERNLLEGLTFFQRINYYVPVLALAMLLLYLLFLQRFLLKPIGQLIKGMRRIYSGDLSARLNDHKLVEFMIIAETFNNMASQIEVLKIDIYEEQLRTKKAELKHLQAQIHPHFFMNSLNIVYNLAQTKSYELIQQMSIHLVKYFRFAIRTHLTSITMQEELDHIRSYLAVQQVRFPEHLAVDIHLAKELEACRIPPSTIQPLVENAMIHGFSFNQGKVFQVHIEVKPDPNDSSYITVRVSDNGKGIPLDKLQLMQSRSYFEMEGSEHVGLWNVIRRCKLYYKAETGIAMENAEPSGAIVTLRLPRLSMEE